MASVPTLFWANSYDLFVLFVSVSIIFTSMRLLILIISVVEFCLRFREDAYQNYRIFC